MRKGVAAAGMEVAGWGLPVVSLFCIWGCHRLAGCVYSELVGEMLAGALLGPALLDWVPFPDAFAWLGQCALLLLVVEAGLHFEIETITHLGWRVVSAATLGVILPLILCPPILWIAGTPFLEAVAASACLSSTSIGFSVTLLRKNNLLASSLGQMISGAAMLDDVESLILLGLLSSWQGSEGILSTFFYLSLPILSSTAILLIGVLLSLALPEVSLWALEVEFDLRSRHSRYSGSSMSSESSQTAPPTERRAIPCEVLLPLILLGTSGLVLLAVHTRTTFLLGAFAAGLSFSKVPEAQEAFQQLSPFISLGLSVFFVSIGFLIPLRIMFSWDIMFLGILLAVPGALSKLALGVFERGRLRQAILGCAMVGRGEVGFMMASSALLSGTISQHTFLLTSWALVLCTALPPLPFSRLVLRLPSSEDRDSLPT